MQMSSYRLSSQYIQFNTCEMHICSKCIHYGLFSFRHKGVGCEEMRLHSPIVQMNSVLPDSWRNYKMSFQCRCSATNQSCEMVFNRVRPCVMLERKKWTKALRRQLWVSDTSAVHVKIRHTVAIRLQIKLTPTNYMIRIFSVSFSRNFIQRYALRVTTFCQVTDKIYTLFEIAHTLRLILLQ